MVCQAKQMNDLLRLPVFHFPISVCFTSHHNALNYDHIMLQLIKHLNSDYFQFFLAHLICSS